MFYPHTCESSPSSRLPTRCVNLSVFQSTQVPYESSEFHMRKFRADLSTVAEIWPCFDFSRWRLSAILDLLYACLDHWRRVFGYFVTVQNLVRIGAVIYSFDNMQVLIFCALGLKIPIHANGGIFCDSWPWPLTFWPQRNGFPEHVVKLLYLKIGFWDIVGKTDKERNKQTNT